MSEFEKNSGFERRLQNGRCRGASAHLQADAVPFRRGGSVMSTSERLRRDNEAQEAVFTLRVPLERADAVEGLLASLLAAMAVDGPAVFDPMERAAHVGEMPETGGPADPAIPASPAGFGGAAAGSLPYPAWPAGMPPQPGYPAPPAYPMPYPASVYPQAAPVGYPAGASMPAGAPGAPGRMGVSKPAASQGGRLSPGVLLKQLRRERGLTQKAVADIAQTTQSRISDYESGVRVMPPAVAQAIARFFGLPIRDFLE